MKKLILSFFISLIFSQLAFSQNEVFAEYSEKYLVENKDLINIDSPSQSLVLYKDSTFKIKHGGCLQITETGKWEISNDVLILTYSEKYYFGYSEMEIKIRYLIYEDKLLALSPDNQVIKSDAVLTKIKNKS